jgi:hypothetical protein
MKQKKKISELVLFKMKKEKYIWLLFLLCLICVLLISFDCKIIPSPFDLDTTEKINTTIISLANNCMVGIIVYLLVTLIPVTKKLQFVMPDFIDDLSELKDDFIELSRKTIGDDFTNAKLPKDEISASIWNIWSEYYDNLLGSYQIPECIIEFYIQMDSKLNNLLLNYGSYLQSDEYERVSKLKNSFIFSQVRKSKKETLPLAANKKTIEQCYIPHLISNQETVNSLYDYFSEIYGYNFQ